MKRIALLAATATCAVSLALVAAACGGETIVEDAPTTDAAPAVEDSAPARPADSGSDAPVDAAREAAAQCAVGLTNTAAEVTSQQGEGGAPTFTGGGTVPDGNWELTELTVYAPISIPEVKAKATARKTGNNFAMILALGGEEDKGEYTLTTSGASFDLAATCGDQAAFEPSGTYEVTNEGGPTVLRVSSPQQAFTVVFAFTKK